MALTIIQQPSEYQPIWHPMMFLASSTSTAEPNFKYQFSIAIGATTRVVSVSPRPDNKGEFDISIHLQDYLDSSDFTLPTADTFTEAPIVEYTVTLTEIYKDALGATVEGTPSVLATKYASDVLLDRLEVLTFDESNYRLDEDGALPLTGQLLFNTAEGDTVYKDDFYYIHAVGIPDSPTVGAVIKEYDSSSTLVTTNTIAGVAGLDAVGAKYLKLDMADIAWNASTVEITIGFTDGSVTASFNKRYKLENTRCSSWDDHRFFYKDKLGSMNMINLDQPSEGSLSIKSKTYDSRIDPLTQVDKTRSTKRYTQSATEMFKANTRSLRANQIYKVEDLLLSTLVFLDVRNDSNWGTLEFIPVEITTSTMKYFKRGNQEIPQYTINYRYSFDKITRR